ncbi:rRNA maturation RNase YbeY [Thermonema lapsum]|uniref:Endoribonuclease YbeY n=1 Tax=Thermonema lapsum TaxID=28195 RepID=A0A846MS60_9BACT|nr:rRNA maturation RNase YbeY [Thermonema lapsum]NIK74416.1 rRNA maturation RNase YbeY [Thermonema lapsum]
MDNINFFFEDIERPLYLSDESKQWLVQIAQHFEAKIIELNYIFCSDNYLLEINRQYLNHDYYTDIITFGYSDSILFIEADAFISIERTEENAQSIGITAEEELHRVMAHGLLHLLGFKDKTEAEAAEMRKMEDWALSLRVPRGT